MIGILLSETAELIYTLGKFSFNGATWVYNWYYDIPTSEELTIKGLKTRVETLEKYINTKEAVKIPEKLD